MKGKYHTAHIEHNGTTYEGHGKSEKAALKSAYDRMAKALGADVPKMEDLTEHVVEEKFGQLPRTLKR